MEPTTYSVENRTLIDIAENKLMTKVQSADYICKEAGFKMTDTAKLAQVNNAVEAGQAVRYLSIIDIKTGKEAVIRVTVGGE